MTASEMGAAKISGPNLIGSARHLVERAGNLKERMEGLAVRVCGAEPPTPTAALDPPPPGDSLVDLVGQIESLLGDATHALGRIEEQI